MDSVELSGKKSNLCTGQVKCGGYTCLCSGGQVVWASRTSLRVLSSLDGDFLTKF